MRLPPEYAEKMSRLFKNEWSDYVKSFDSPRLYGFRANTLKISPDELAYLLSGEECCFEKISWCGSGMYYDPDKLRLSKDVYYSAGLYYLQEPSAMLPCGLLDIKPGDRVLDLCASPGGKSAQAAGLLKGKGLLVSNDANAPRMTPLIKNLELTGITNGIVTNELPGRLAARFEGFFDKIIIDAPCSGEGMFRKDSDAMLAWDKGKAGRLSGIQYGLLNEGKRMLAAGGLMSYSTCTFAPEENELLIRRFLDENDDFEIVAVNHERFGVSSARADWAEGDERLSRAARVFPHIHKGEGHFAAVLRKIDGGKDGTSGRFKAVEAGKDDLALFDEAVGCNMINRPKGRICKHNGVLFIPPEGLPDLSGLRISRGGFYLGDLRKNRFVPSKALALALKKDDYAKVIDFHHGDIDLGKYINGESFDIDAENGYYLICAEGYPAGMAKITGGRLKWRTG